jgi:hypothetical protein
MAYDNVSSLAVVDELTRIVDELQSYTDSHVFSQIPKKTRKLLEQAFVTLKESKRYGGLGSVAHPTTTSVFCSNYIPSVLVITIIPSLLLLTSGWLGQVWATNENVHSALEQIASGGLLHIFTAELYAKWQQYPINMDDMIRRATVLLDVFQKVIRHGEAKSSGLRKPYVLTMEDRAVLHFISEDVSFGVSNSISQNRSHSIGLFVISTLGFTAGIVIDGLLRGDLDKLTDPLARCAPYGNGSLVAVEEGEDDGTHTFRLLIPFLLTFASDGIVLAYEVGVHRSIPFEAWFLCVVISIDNVLDGSGLSLEVSKFEDGNSFVYLLILALTIPVAAVLTGILRVLTGNDGPGSQYVHTALRSFGIACVASSALALSSFGFTLWTLIGFLAAWAFSFVGLVIEGVLEENEDDGALVEETNERALQASANIGTLGVDPRRSRGIPSLHACPSHKGIAVESSSRFPTGWSQ